MVEVIHQDLVILLVESLLQVLGIMELVQAQVRKQVLKELILEQLMAMKPMVM